MDTMYKFQPIMQLARKIDSDEIKSKENLINNAFKILWKNECKVLFHQLNQSNNQYLYYKNLLKQ